VFSAITFLHSSVKWGVADSFSVFNSSVVIWGIRCGLAVAMVFEAITTLATVTRYSFFSSPKNLSHEVSNLFCLSTRQRLAIMAMAFQTSIRYLLSRSSMKRSKYGYNCCGYLALSSIRTLAQPYRIVALSENSPFSIWGSKSKLFSTLL
jgi:hypothetical protein